MRLHMPIEMSSVIKCFLTMWTLLKDKKRSVLESHYLKKFAIKIELFFYYFMFSDISLNLLNPNYFLSATLYLRDIPLSF